MKRILLVAIALFAIGFIGLLVTREKLPDIEVSSQTAFGARRVLVIKNVGVKPLTITGVSINDRVECTLEGDQNLPIELRRKIYVRGWAQSEGDRVIKIGESAVYVIMCEGEIVRATIRTDDGSGTYTFSARR